MLAREAAFVALQQWNVKGTFLWDSLQSYKERYKPDPSDLNFAYELACGSMRMMRYLDTVAKGAGSVPKKAKERMLLRLGLYQRLFCPNIPIYAVVDSTVEVAKKYAHKAFCSFLNQALRKELHVPEMSLAARYSVTDYFAAELLTHYGEEVACSILERSNLPTPHMKVLYGDEQYTQNRTQVELLQRNVKALKRAPKTILDLCAAPGGKTLLLHQMFPEAHIVANEKVASKIPLMEQNFARFSCPAQIVCSDGRDFHFPFPFDLIMVDAPCSNSGVLYKCPEARWRIEKDEIAGLQDTQIALLKAACDHLAEHGKIIYQTCSILPQEHEEVIKRSGMHPEVDPLLQLPDNQGHEGGFSCLLSPTSE